VLERGSPRLQLHDLACYCGRVIGLLDLLANERRDELHGAVWHTANGIVSKFSGKIAPGLTSVEIRPVRKDFKSMPRFRNFFSAQNASKGISSPIYSTEVVHSNTFKSGTLASIVRSIAGRFQVSASVPSRHFDTRNSLKLANQGDLTSCSMKLGSRRTLEKCTERSAGIVPSAIVPLKLGFYHTPPTATNHKSLLP
jgi:hypothetical protein